MTNESIAEIAIDADGRLLISPLHSSFNDLHQAGAFGFQWEAASSALVSPKPIEWGYLDWFKHVLAVIANNYGTALKAGNETKWKSVPDTVREALEAFSASDWLSQLEHGRVKRNAEYWSKHELEQALREADDHWTNGNFKEVCRVLEPLSDRLPPARTKRLEIAKKRAANA